MEYFDHKKFKRFFKRVRSLGWTVNLYFEENNSIELPAYIIDVNIKLESLKMDLWDCNATYHYTINDKYSFDVPADAEYIPRKDVFGYIWRDGPTHYLIFKKV